jgi:(2Fe-2S) ferredoxin
VFFKLPIPAIDYQTGSVLYQIEEQSRMKSRKTPYKCHIFICRNARGGERKSCGDSGEADIKARLKDEINERGWKGKVRVSESGCLGVCEVGPNIMIYPQGIWLAQVKSSDVPEILNTVEQLLSE